MKNNKEFPKFLSVKVSLSYQDPGLERICDILLEQDSQTAQTRMFRLLVLRSWHQGLASFPDPSTAEKQRWITDDRRVAVNLRVNAEDPSASGLFQMLSQLPDHRSRVAAIRRLFFDALYMCRPPGQEKDSIFLPFVPGMPVFPDTSPSSNSNRAATPQMVGTDSIPPPPAIPAAQPAPQPVVATPVTTPAPHDASTPAPTKSRRHLVSNMLAGLNQSVK